MNRKVIIGGLTGAASGALYGAIGASAGKGSDKPVLKGAATSALVGGVLSTAAWAIIFSEEELAALEASEVSEASFP